ncbi:MAG: M24 family metallopeptidase [Terriglobales bacterium]
MDYRSRRKRIQELLSRNRLDALLVTHLPNIRYLCGFTGSSAVLVLTEIRSVFVTDGRYIAQAKDEVKAVPITIARQSPLLSAAEWLLESIQPSAGNRARNVGIEGEHMTVSTRTKLSKKLGSRFTLKEAPPLIEQARTIKDAREIKLIRAAVQMGGNLFSTVLKNLRPGVTENAVSAELEYAARRAGAEQMSFPAIIASGKRSALPHGRASEAKIPAKGFVVCDFGVILAGYCSDMTRTIHMGSPTTKEKRAYEAVREAQHAAIEAVKPGAGVGEVDGAARKALKKHVLSRYFTHSTGHGVGLEIHESPRIAVNQNEVLQPGMVITIEPGIYIPGKWGIRIEDMVLVTQTGCEVLTPVTKELITL